MLRLTENSRPTGQIVRADLALRVVPTRATGVGCRDKWRYPRRRTTSLVLADDSLDRSCFFGCRAEDRRTWKLAIEVGHDRHRFVTDEIAILQDRHSTARVQPEHLRRFLFLLGKLQQVRPIGNFLVFEREEHAPRVRSAASHIDVDGNVRDLVFMLGKCMRVLRAREAAPALFSRDMLLGNLHTGYRVTRKCRVS
jgi:hypothetical protein